MSQARSATVSTYAYAYAYAYAYVYDMQCHARMRCMPVCELGLAGARE